MNPELNRPLEGSPLGSPDAPVSTARSVRTMFEAVAPRYDFLNHFLSGGLDIHWRRVTARCLRELLAGADSMVLDICCGTGDLALALGRVAAGNVVAADFCRPMLDRAQEKSRNQRKPVIFLGADALELPLADRSVDVVTSAFGFRNLANYSIGLREMFRVLKPGGAAAILEFSHVEWPVFGPVFRFYLAHILPRLGAWISGVEGPYEYLHDSISRFPGQELLAKALRRAGFINVRYRNFLGGVAALHRGERPA